MNPLIHFKTITPRLLITLLCFGLLPQAQAVVPPPDGGYPGLEHGGRAKCPFASRWRHLQHGPWLGLTGFQRHRQLQHGRRRSDSP